MANWIIRCAEDYLLPVVEYLRQQLLAREVILVMKHRYRC